MLGILSGVLAVFMEVDKGGIAADAEPAFRMPPLILVGQARLNHAQRLRSGRVVRLEPALHPRAHGRPVRVGGVHPDVEADK